MSDLIEIAKIDRTGGTQSRAALNEDVIADYAEAMKDGSRFPDIWLVYDGTHYFVTDGFHRIEAALRAGWKEINASVVTGTIEDAQWQSYGVNKAHGLRRSNDDKRRAVVAALKHPQGAAKSDREIGRHVGVDHVTVQRYRKDLELSGEIHQIEQREVTRNGTTYSQEKPTERHWGLRNGTPFWHEVERLGLRNTNVLDQLQSGATHLTDLSLSKEDAFARLKVLAQAQLLRAFPIGSYVRHPASGRVATVTGCAERGVAVFDEVWGSPDFWDARGVVAATDEQRQRYLNPPPVLQVGDTVRTRTNHITRITKIDGGFVYVDGDTRGHRSEQLTKIDPLPEADDPMTEAQAEEDEQLAEQVKSDAPETAPDPLGDWHKKLTSTGILSVASSIPDWDSLNWLERYRAIKQAFCPNFATDPFLCIQVGDAFFSFDRDAESIAGAVNKTLVMFSRHPQSGAASMHTGALFELQRLGASGVISYRDPSVNEYSFQLLDEVDKTMPALPLAVKERGGFHILVAADDTELATFRYNKGLGPELAQYIAELVNQAQMEAAQ